MRVPVGRWLLILTSLAGSACASSGAAPQPFPVPGARPARPAAAPPTTARPDETAAAVLPDDESPVVATALGLRGTAYRTGGSDPAGFDCSGFVWYVFAQNGVAMPRTVADQFRVGRPVKARDLKPGDLVFFDTGGTPVSHVGVVVAGDAFVHAPSARGEVRVEHLGAPYWSSRYVGARRLP